MSKTFWVLLLVNFVLLGYIQRDRFMQEDGGLQPQGLNPDSIRLAARLPETTRSEAPVVPAAENAGASSVPAASDEREKGGLQMALSLRQPATARVQETSCLEWGDFSGTELALAQGVIASLQLGRKLGRREVEQVVRYWVYIPPLNGKEELNLELNRIKKLGINEFFVVQEPPQWRNAISLGVFKSRESARNYLKILQERKLTEARLGERNGKQQATIFSFQNVSSSVASRLELLQKDFPGSELKKIACGN